MLLMSKVVRRISSALVAISLVTSIVATPVMASATVVNPTSTAKVSFTFDDGLDSAMTQAAPTLKKYGFVGTDYVISNCIGMTTVPNTCHANTDAKYMTWAQVNSLNTTYGWEIGSHTQTHPYLATSDPVDQPLPISAAQVTKELTQSKADLAAHGINATDFAPPYGDYNMSVLAQIAKYYASMRGFQDTGYNTWPNSDYLIRDQHIEGPTTVATAKTYIDTAIKNNQWLVLTFHDIKTTASTNAADYEYSTKNLDAIAAYVKSKNIPVVTVGNGLVTSTTNLMPNPSFNSGISGGWTTDNATAVTADSATNGSYPDPKNSVKLTSGATNAHLFSPKVAVDPTATYMLKNFLNVQHVTSSGLGFYIDEYDSFGNWISGQYKATEPSVFVESLNFTYKPTSANVKQASLQVILPANSGIVAYMDNSQMFSLTATTVTPPPTGKISQVNNLATGKTFTSNVGPSVTQPGNPLNNVNDKNEATRWISLPQDGANVSVDLGAAYALNKVSILWSGDTTKNYDVQVSTDNIAWTTVASGLTNNTSPQLIDHPIVANGRYVRIVCKDRWNTTYGNSIWEIGIYGSTPSLVTNGAFDSGIGGGWTTDNAAAFVANSASHGSPNNIVNSVALSAQTAKNAHLFSPKVVVTPKAYSLTAYVNLLTRTSGELGFYIDEYDAAGTWISGQYKGGVSSVASGDFAISYTPSSSSVASASLQVILVGDSGITGYIDDIRWN